MGQINLLDAFKNTATASAQKAVDLIKSKRGAIDGFASLDANGKVPASQLPSALDEVIEIKVSWGMTDDGVEYIQSISDVNDNVMSSNDMQRDVLYVNVTEDKYANNIYRWTGSTLVPCPTMPKTEDLTVEFEEGNNPSYSPDNITSGSTLSVLFATIQKAILSVKYIGSQFQGLHTAYNSHASDTTKHIKGVDITPTENSENVVTSHGIYTALSSIDTNIQELKYYKDNPDELPFMEEAEFNTAINTALNNVS